MTLRAKICGVCSVADAVSAVAAGADYIGVILAAGYGRSRTLDEAAAIYAAVAVHRVGVFVDPTAAEVHEAARRFGLHAVQLHGDESIQLVHDIRAAVSDLDRPPLVWKSVAVRSPEQAAADLDVWSEVVDAILLDGWSATAHGGAGASFDWQAMQARLQRRSRSRELVVAGGLTPENVAGVVRILDPDIVDVSSGVEEGPGRKSAARMRAFIAAARQATAAHFIE